MNYLSLSSMFRLAFNYELTNEEFNEIYMIIKDCRAARSGYGIEDKIKKTCAYKNASKNLDDSKRQSLYDCLMKKCYQAIVVDYDVIY